MRLTPMQALDLLDELINIAHTAGDAIMEVYASDNFDVSAKDDESPLTRADLAANSIITDRLANLAPDIPLLSEEGEHADYETRKNWEAFFLVDPLDGTKEFVKRRDEFTVNIAIIQDRKPLAGVVYAPALERLYTGVVGIGATLTVLPHSARIIHARHDDHGTRVAVGSKSHPKPADQTFFEAINAADKRSRGSSLKFCLVAEGEADVYFRSGPTSKWETGAGQAVALAAGADMQAIDGPFVYNKENILNPGFACWAPSVGDAEVEQALKAVVQK